MLRYIAGVSLFFLDMVSEMTGLLKPKSSKKLAIFFFEILVLYLGHRVFHPAIITVLIFLQNQFSGEVFITSQTEG